MGELIVGSTCRVLYDGDYFDQFVILFQNDSTREKLKIRGDACRQITSPFLTFTLRLDLFNEERSEYSIVEVVNVNRKGKQPTITKIVKEAEKVGWSPRKGILNPKHFNVKKNTDPIVSSSYEAVVNCRGEDGYLTKNILRDAKFFHMLNVLGYHVVHYLKAEELNQLSCDDIDAKNLYNILGIALITTVNHEKIDIYIESRRDLISDEMVNFLEEIKQTSPIFDEFENALHHYRQHFIIEKIDHPWSSNQKTIILQFNSLKKSVLCQAGARFCVKHEKYFKIELAISKRLEELTRYGCKIVLYDNDIDDDDFFIDNYIKRRIDTYDNWFCICTCQYRLRWFLSLFLGNRKYQMFSHLSSMSRPPSKPRITVDRSHVADLVAFSMMLEKLPNDTVLLELFGCARTFSDGVGTPFRDICKSKVFTKEKRGADRLSFSPSRLFAYTNDDEWQTTLESCIQLKQSEIRSVPSVILVLASSKDKHAPSTYKNVYSYWLQENRDRPLADIMVIFTENSDRSRILKSILCASPSNNSIILVGSLDVTDRDIKTILQSVYNKKYSQNNTHFMSLLRKKLGHLNPVNNDDLRESKRICIDTTST